MRENGMQFGYFTLSENVIAGADCGFASFAATCEVHPSIVWVKLQALADGARLASRELWRKARPDVAP
jgi:5-methyltetrahydropteroyltriglutamate--homocysteine methyltransferase